MIRLLAGLALAASGVAQAQAQAPAPAAPQALAPATQPPAQAQSEIDAKPALEAARIWLATLDAGRYGASWEDAAPAIRDSITKVQWETGLDRARAPLGIPIVRKIRQASCSRGTQADPEAEICVILYDTRFQERPLAAEQATVLRGRDGSWRVAAYQLR